MHVVSQHIVLKTKTVDAVSYLIRVNGAKSKVTVRKLIPTGIGLPKVWLSSRLSISLVI
jgi:hypothetical protein